MHLVAMTSLIVVLTFACCLSRSEEPQLPAVERVRLTEAFRLADTVPRAHASLETNRRLKETYRNC